MDAPEPPDPYETAAAQGGMNRDTAISQQLLNFTDQYTPDGSLVYTQNGTKGYTDSTGKWVELPSYVATTSLSPAQQAIKDQVNGASLNLATLANQQSGFLKDYLGKGIDTSGVTPMRTDFGPNYNEKFSGDIGGGFNSKFSGKIGGGFNTNFARNIGGSYTDTLGSGYDTDVDLARSYQGADDFSADRQRVEDALWQRGQSERTLQEQSLRTQLANKGIREGSAAYNTEMERLARQNADAQMAAILAGGQEQSRLVNLARDAAIFGNEAELAQTGFGNNAITNQFQLQNQAALGQAQFAQNAQNLQNQSALGQAQFGQNAQSLTNQSALAAAGYGRESQAMQNQAAMAAAGFNNNVRGQQMGELYAARNQPINEISALMSGAQVNNPQFQSTPQTGVAGVDYTGLVNQKYQAELANQQAMMGGIFGIGSALIGMSDRRAKRDIRRIGRLRNGLPWYSFRYLGDDTPQEGVMSDDVRAVMPEAVIVGADGLDRVDYGRVLA